MMMMADSDNEGTTTNNEEPAPSDSDDEGTTTNNEEPAPMMVISRQMKVTLLKMMNKKIIDYKQAVVMKVKKI